MIVSWNNKEVDGLYRLHCVRAVVHPSNVGNLCSYLGIFAWSLCYFMCSHAVGFQKYKNSLSCWQGNEFCIQTPNFCKMVCISKWFMLLQLAREHFLLLIHWFCCIRCSQYYLCPHVVWANATVCCASESINCPLLCSLCQGLLFFDREEGRMEVWLLV